MAENQFIKNLQAGNYKNPHTAPKPKAAPAPKFDAVGWAETNGRIDGRPVRDVAAESRRVDISMDPTTRNINISAPQWYLDSPEFKEQVLPEFQKLEGRNIDDNQFKAIMDAGMRNELQKQLDALHGRQMAIQEYKTKFPEATDNDAMTFLRNVATANESKGKEAKTNIIVGVNPDGSPITTTVRQYLEGWNKVGDREKSAAIKRALKTIDSPDSSEMHRAINASLLQIMQKKGITKASTKTKWEVGLNEFLTKTDNSGIGKIVNKIFDIAPSIAGKGKTIAEEARENAKADADLDVLEGVSGMKAAGGVAGEIASIGADVGATIPLGGAGVLAKTKEIPKIGSIVSKVDDLSRAGNTAVKITAQTAKQVPQDVAFGALHSAGDADFNAGQDLATSTAINAGLFGGARVVSNVIRHIDTQSGGALGRLSDEVGKGILRGVDAIQSIPGLGTAMKKLSINFVDEAGAAKRAYRNAYAYSEGAEATKTAKQDYYDINNIIRLNAQRGAPQARAFRADSPTFNATLDVSSQLQKSGQLEQANAYVTKATVLERAEAGQYDMKPAEIENLRLEVAELSRPEFEQYRQQIVNTTREITDYGVRMGILDDDLIKYMEENPEFADDYIHLQYDMSSRKNPYTGQGSPKNQKNVAPVKRIRGVSQEELLDPFLVMNQRLEATARLAVQNRMNVMIARGVKEGAVSGRVITDAADVKMLGDLKFAAAIERESVEAALKVELEGLGNDLNLLVDDVEDFAGSGQRIIESRIEESLDRMEDIILENPKLQDEITGLMDQLGNGKEGAEMVAAIGILHRQKANVTKAIKEKLLDSPLGSDERKLVADMFRNSIVTRFDEAMASVGMGQRTGVRELNERRNEIKRLNAELGSVSERNAKNTIAYFENGQKGYIELDDPDLADYFNSRKLPQEDGLLARFMTATSRVFRLGTTGLDPIFVFGVNPLRDIPQAAVTAGVDVLAPQNLHRTLMEMNGMSSDEANRIIEAIADQKDEAYRMGTFAATGRREGDVGTKRLPWESEVSRMSRDDRKTYEALQAEARSAGAQGMKGHVINTVSPKRALTNIENVMSKVELVTRSHIYNARLASALRRGASVDEAMSEAMFYGSEATANFLNVGAKTRQFVRTVPYLMAAVNGKASFMRLFALDPVGVSARLFGGIAAPAMFLTAYNLQDEERAADYFNLPDYEKRTNFLIMLGGGEYIKIPMSYELANLVNPFRDAIELHHGIDNESWQRIFGRAALGAAQPFDTAGFFEQDFDGSTDWGRGAAQLAGSFVPQAFRPVVEGLSGQNMYTGQPLNPTDEEMIARGQVEPDEEITAGDRTYTSRDSKILRGIADAIGVDQGIIQTTFSTYTGTVGQYLLNAADRLVGAEGEPVGGRDVAEGAAKRFFGDVGITGGKAMTDYYAGIDRLGDEKEKLLKRLDRMAYQNRDEEDDEAEGNAMRQKLIDDFGQKVATFADKFGQYYSRVGGLKPTQVTALMNTLNLGPQGGIFEAGSYQEDMLGDVKTEAWNDANRRAQDLGLPSTADRDIFGKTTVTNGVVGSDFYSSTLANGTIRNRIYGAPKQIAYEMNELTKGDRKKGIKSLYEEKQAYDKEISALYDAARGLKGAAATEAYKRISDKKEEYMTMVFDERIRPLIDKYGVAVLRNSKVAKEITSYVEVPDDLTPFASRTKQPFQTDDVWRYLKVRYGVEETMNGQNLPSDEEALQRIEKINADIAGGRRASANYQLSLLDKQISQGKVYVDHETMDEIAGMIKALNKRR